MYRELSCLVASRGDTTEIYLYAHKMVALGFIVTKAAMSWDLILKRKISAIESWYLRVSQAFLQKEINMV